MAKKKHPQIDPAAPEFYEARKGDTSLWASHPSRVTVSSTGTVVFSVRFGTEELEEVRDAAAVRGTTISDLVRSAVLQVVRAEPVQIIALGERTYGPHIACVSGVDATILQSGIARSDSAVA